MLFLTNSLQLVQQVSLIYIMLGITRFVIGLSRKIHHCGSEGLEQWNYGVGIAALTIKIIYRFKVRILEEITT